MPVNPLLYVSCCRGQCRAFQTTGPRPQAVAAVSLRQYPDVCSSGRVVPMPFQAMHPAHQLNLQSTLTLCTGATVYCSVFVLPTALLLGGLRENVCFTAKLQHFARLPKCIANLTLNMESYPAHDCVEQISCLFMT